MFHAGQRILLVSCLVAAACAKDEGAPTKPAPAKTDPSSAEPADAMGRQLREEARAHAPGYLPAGMFFRDHVDRGAQRDFLAVLKSERCYRFVGVGDPEVEDLDLVLYDPQGVQLQQDLSQDANPMLGVEAELCPAWAGAYRLQVRMTAGRGEFLVGVYRSP